MRFPSKAAPVLSDVVPSNLTDSLAQLKRFFAVKSLSGLAVLVLLVASCADEPTTPPQPPHVPTIELTLDEAGVTEAWLKVKVSSPLLTTSWVLERNGQSALYIASSLADTVVMDDSLAPGATHIYRAIRFENQTRVDSTPLLQVRTMDTTSHEFTWELEYLGDGSGGALYDVAVINDTLAYAVGEINIKDSSGQWVQPPYNFAKWNGTHWELSTSSDVGYGYGPLYCIFAVSSSEVWAGSTIPERWMNGQWTFFGSTRGYVGGFNIKGLYGTSSNDIVVVGDGGNIRRFDGSAWRQIQSGTTMPLVDIWGSRHSTSRQTEILSLASDQFQGTVSSLIRLNGTTAMPAPSDGLPGSLATLWFVSGRRYIIAGAGLYSSPTLGPTWRREIGLPAVYTGGVRGTGLNNIFAVGHYGLVLHHNGVSWRDMTSQVGFLGGDFGRVDAKGRLVIAVGGTGSKAAVLIGRRIGS